jgi:hypothetical protein
MYFLALFTIEVYVLFQIMLSAPCSRVYAYALLAGRVYNIYTYASLIEGTNTVDVRIECRTGRREPRPVKIRARFSVQLSMLYDV